MRRSVPSWFILLAVLGVFASTALCATGAYLVAQQFAVDLGDSGVQVALTDFNTFAASQPTPTAQPTTAPTASVDASQSAAPDEDLTVTEEADADSAGEGRSVENTPTSTPDPVADLPEMEPGRLNILLLGIDQRIGFDTEKGYRSDTMMLISVNTISKQVGMISIPRDLVVEREDGTLTKITNVFAGGPEPVEVITVRDLWAPDLHPAPAALALGQLQHRACPPCRKR